MLQDQDFNSYYAIETAGYTWCLITLSASLLDESEYAPEPFLEKELASFALDNVFSELIEDYPYYHIEDGIQLFYLLYLDEEHLTLWEQNSERIFTFLGDFFKKYGNNVLTGVVSGYTNDFSRIDTLYLDVMRVLEHRRAMDEIGIVCTKSYAQQRWLFENESWFVSLKTAVSEGDEKSAMALADSVFSRFREGSLDFSIQKIQVNECMYHVLVVFQQIVSDYTAQQQLVDQVLSIAIHTESGSDLYEKFVNALHYACGVVQRTLHALNNTLIDQIDAYIEENYNDVNLNVATIAEHFGKHPNYISKIYFSETGIMLLNRIHKARIDHAKELLRQGGMTIAQIADQTGFGNTRTFRRVFAKETGLTPSEYQRK